MTDEELIARAREIASALIASSFAGGSDRDRLAAGLLKELADRLEARPVPDEAE